MKKKPTGEFKLELSRETVRRLDAAQTKDARGGCQTFACRDTQPCCVDSFHPCGLFCQDP